MAFGKKKESAPADKPTRTLADFPAYQAALGKLNDIDRRQYAANNELQNAVELESKRAGLSATHRIAEEAGQVLDGGAVTATLAAPIPELRHRCQVLEEAVRIQQRIVEEERRNAAREIAADMLDEHKDVVDHLAVAGKVFIVAHAEIAAFRARYAAASGGQFEGVLRELDLNSFFMERVKNDVAVFTDNVKEYLGL